MGLPTPESLIGPGRSARTDGGADFWQAINTINNLKYLIIETAFSNAESELARLSKHLCPNTLAQQLAYLQSAPQVFITHLKPGEDAKIMQEIAANPKTQHCKALLNQYVMEL